MTPAKPRKLVALSTFSADVDGATVLVHAGDTFPSDHPVLEGRGELFVVAAEYVQTAGTPPTP